MPMAAHDLSCASSVWGGGQAPILPAQNNYKRRLVIVIACIVAQQQQKRREKLKLGCIETHLFQVVEQNLTTCGGGHTFVCLSHIQLHVIT